MMVVVAQAPEIIECNQFRDLRGLMQEEASAARPAECENAIPSEPESQAQAFAAVPAPVARSRNEKTAGGSCSFHPHKCARLSLLLGDPRSRRLACAGTLAFHMATLAFVQNAGRLGTSLPVWSCGDQNGLLPLFHQGFNAYPDKRLDFRLVARRI
jgi:hypothetical protein